MPLVRTEDLIDANTVAELLGLSHRNSVSGYQRRYPDMPRPVVTFGEGRTPVWLRSEIEQWLVRRGAVHPGRPRGSNAAAHAEGATAAAVSEGNAPPGVGGASGGGAQRTTRRTNNTTP